jgi:hypothetical protein
MTISKINMDENHVLPYLHKYYFKQFFKVMFKKWQDLDTARNVFPFFVEITNQHGTLHIPQAPLKVARAK